MDKLHSRVAISHRAMCVTVAFLLSLNRLSSVVVMAGDLGSGSSASNAQNIAISVSITASGTSTAGQTYRLMCSANVTGSTDQTTFTWLHNSSNITSDICRMDTGDGSYSSNLTFSPLSVSHAGTYTCKVTAGGVTETQTIILTVNGIDNLNNLFKNNILKYILFLFSLLTQSS